MTPTEYQRVWRAKNVERNREIQAAFKSRNPNYQKQWYASNPEKAAARRAKDKAYQKKYNKLWTLANKDILSAKTRLQRLAGGLKLRARDAVHKALISGRLTRLPCERCGEAKTEAHHPDYTKRLEVIWLCDVCHGLEHRKYK